MKLLSPNDAQAKAKKSLDSEKYRLVEVQKLITQKYKELGTAEADFARVLDHQRLAWAKEEFEYNTKIVSLGKLVDDLEERKKQALIPLTERAKELDTKASALTEYERILKNSDADIVDKAEMLARRLDEVSERELQADSIAKALTRREEGAKLQEGRITADSARLTVAIAEAGKEAQERETRLLTAEAALKGKVAHAEERERLVNEKEASLVKREVLLADRQALVEREFKELTEKQSGSGWNHMREGNS